VGINDFSWNLEIKEIIGEILNPERQSYESLKISRNYSCINIMENTSNIGIYE
jgi:hypothetical protein